MSRNQEVKGSGHQDVLGSGYQGIGVSGCWGIGVSGYQGVRVSEYRGIRVLGQWVTQTLFCKMKSTKDASILSEVNFVLLTL